MSAEVFVRAHSLCDGGGDGQSWRPVEEINGAAGDHPLALHAADTHTALRAFLLLSIPQRDPFFPFLSPPLTPACLHSPLLYNISHMQQVFLDKAAASKG